MSLLLCKCLRFQSTNSNDTCDQVVTKTKPQVLPFRVISWSSQRLALHLVIVCVAIPIEADRHNKVSVYVLNKGCRGRSPPVSHGVREAQPPGSGRRSFPVCKCTKGAARLVLQGVWAWGAQLFGNSEGSRSASSWSCSDCRNAGTCSFSRLSDSQQLE